MRWWACGGLAFTMLSACTLTSEAPSASTQPAIILCLISQCTIQLADRSQKTDAMSSQGLELELHGGVIP